MPALVLMASGAEAAAFSASAASTPKAHYLGDTGSMFRFTIANTGSSSNIGAVEIRRPSSAWTVRACPMAPSGWRVQASDTMCRYRSQAVSSDDIKPGKSSSLFALKADVGTSAQDIPGNWIVTVSRTHTFDNPSTLVSASAGAAGLNVTAHSFQILAAGVSNGAAVPGAACPNLTKSAVTGTTQELVVCGRNRSTTTATPTEASSSLSGSFVGTPGTFSSAPIAPGSASVVLGKWTGTAVTSTFGPGKNIVTKIAASSAKSSPTTTVLGFEATNRPPVALAGDGSTNEDTALSTVTLKGVDDDGDDTTFAIVSAPAHGTLSAVGSATCDAVTPRACQTVLTYTPDDDYFGEDSFTYTAADGHSTSAPATFDLTVTPVNDAPGFTKGADQTVDEDAAAQTVSGWATGIAAGPANEASQSVTLRTLNVSNPALFLAQPAVSNAGALTYTPAPNTSGSSTVTLDAQDDGGTANGGDDTSDAQTFTITVNSVNDEPTFTKGADVTVLEDSGAASLSGWATNLSTGPADESGQTASYELTSDDTSLFSVQPAIDAATGTLTFTPAANEYGAATVTALLKDNGGTANGGDDSSSQTFTINVTPVNDAPGFTKGANQSVNEDAGAQTVSGWATAVSAGPNETQGLTFSATPDNPGLFSAAPAVDPATGALTYTAAPNANGVITVTVELSDDGGTSNGGVDTSSPQTFTITVNAVNDAPSFTKGADVSSAEDAGAQSVSNWASAISKGPGDESGQNLSFTTSNNNNSLFSVQPGVTPTGTLVYTAAPDAFGVATVTISLADDGGTALGGDDTSDPQTFTITINNVNDAPFFDGANQAVDEDSGAQTVNPWATNISAGPNESESVTLAITDNDNAGLFSAGPQLSDTGVLTYTPADNTSGVANLTATATDASGGTFDRDFTITVNSLNDNPSFTGGADQTVSEDSGPKTVTGWASNISGGANESDAVTFSITANDNADLFSAAPAVSPAGDLTFTPAANKSGVANLTVTADDGNGGTASDSLVITVTSVNDEPSFTKGAEPVVVVGSGEQTIPGWATDISAGPNEAAQALTFQLNEEDGTFLVGDATIDPATGDLTFTPANKVGTELIHVLLKDDGGTADGGDDTYQTSFTMQFVPPNATPVAQATSASGNEDGGAMTVTLTGTDADDDNLTFEVGTATNGLVTVPGAIDCTTVANTCTTTVTYTPNSNYNGGDSFTYTVDDGTVDSEPATATITVNPVNDEPSFTKGANQAVDEDAGAQTVSGWATNISAGPENESSQTVAINRVSTTNDALFSALPSVDSTTGSLSYTPAPNQHGSATVTLRATDNGGTANGGDDTGQDQTFTITVNSVNDVPVAGDDAQTTNEDTFVNLAVKGNDTDADNDALSFQAFDATSAKGATVSDNGDGTLKYNPAGKFDGLQVDEPNETDTFAYTVSDGNGGTDTATVTITITPVNDAPVAVSESQSGIVGNTLHAVSTTHSGPRTTGTGELDDGVVDPDDTVFTVTAGAVNSTNSGTATIAADGTYTYLPPQGYTGNDTFSFTVNDAHGGSDTETATMTIANMAWYVDNAAANPGDGRSSSPFNAIAPLTTGGSADAKDGANDHIFLYQGTSPYTGGLALETGQKLWGQPHGLTVAGNALVPAGGTKPTVGGGVALGGNSDVQGLTLGTAAGAYSLTGTNPGSSAVGTVTPVDLNNPTGGGISLSGGTPTVTLASLTSGGGAGGITLSNVGGPVTVSAGAISGFSGTGVSVTGGSSTVSNAAPVTAGSAARSLNVVSRSGGTVTQSGTVVDNGLGVNLASNAGSTMLLTGQLTLNTGGNNAFNVTGGGTVSAPHASNTAATTTGRAVNIANTNIHSDGVRFANVASNGAVSGILLDSTGSTGSLTVNDGTILNSTSHGIDLNNTRSPSFNSVTINNSGGQGVEGNNLTNFTFTNGSIDTSGTAGAADASNIGLNTTGTGTETNVTGVVTITGNSLTNARHHGVDVFNYNGTISDLTVSNNTITSSAVTASSLGSAIRVHALGGTGNAANVTRATISGNNIDNFPQGAGIVVQGGNASTGPTNNVGTPGSASNKVVISGNEIDGDPTTKMGTNGILVTMNGKGSGNFEILNNGTVANPMNNIKGVMISGGVFGNATASIKVDGNRLVGDTAGFDAPGIGVGTSQTSNVFDAPVANVTITNNNVSGTEGQGILTTARDARGTLNARIVNNVVGAPQTAAARQGIRIDAGNNTASSDETVCLDISGNTSGESIPGAKGIGIRKQGTDPAVHSFGIVGMAATATPGVENYVDSQNPAGGGTLLVSASSGFGSCTLPF